MQFLYHRSQAPSTSNEVGPSSLVESPGRFTAREHARAEITRKHTLYGAREGNTPQAAERSVSINSRYSNVWSAHGARTGCVSGLVTPIGAHGAGDCPGEHIARKGILRRDFSANQLRLICCRYTCTRYNYDGLSVPGVWVGEWKHTKGNIFGVRLEEDITCRSADPNLTTIFGRGPMRGGGDTTQRRGCWACVFCLGLSSAARTQPFNTIPYTPLEETLMPCRRRAPCPQGSVPWWFRTILKTGPARGLRGVMPTAHLICPCEDRVWVNMSLKRQTSGNLSTAGKPVDGRFLLRGPSTRV